MSESAKKVWLWLLLVLPFLGWNFAYLTDLDEGFYAAVTTEMNRRHEWIIPFYNGHPWFEKPILIYWLAKPSVAAFGLAWGARLPSVIATLCLAGLLLWFGNRRLGKDAGYFAATIFGTSLLVVALGRMMMTDPLLDLGTAAAMIFFWESLEGDPRWRIASAACLGAAVLAKGPVAGAFFIPAALWVWLGEPRIDPSFKAKWKGGWAVSIVAFFAVVASWFLPAYLREHQVFVQKFIVEQNIQRFQGGDAAHQVTGIARWIYYIPVLLLGMFPWSLHLFQTFRGLNSPLKRFLAAWALTVFGLFTVSGSKLPSYILPAFPPLALLISAYLTENGKTLDRARLIRWAAGAAGLCVLANAVFIGLSNAFYRQLHLLADAMKEHPGDRAYFVGLSGGDEIPNPAGASEPKLFGFIPIRTNPTSHPSLLAILNRTVEDVSVFPYDMAPGETGYVLTRFGHFPGPATRVPVHQGSYQIQDLTDQLSGGETYRPYQLFRVTCTAAPAISAGSQPGTQVKTTHPQPLPK